MQVLGQNKGVCRDDVVGGIDSFQLHTHTRENGINTITFRRTLISGDAGDKEFRLDAPMFAVWAIGRLDSNNEPAFHDIYPKKDVVIHFNTSEPVDDCFSFSRSEAKLDDIWERSQIFDRCFIQDDLTQRRKFYSMILRSCFSDRFDHLWLRSDRLAVVAVMPALQDTFQTDWLGI